MASLTPQVVGLLAKQIRSLHSTPPEGITFQPGDTLTELFADIAGPVGTPYEGGLFKVKLIIGSDYPSAPPKGYFLTKLFHPNVSLGGDICVNTLKRDWTPDTTLSHILAVVRCLLIVPFPESSLNDEAGRLFMESYDEYARKARVWTDIHARSGVSSASAGTASSGGAGEASASAGAAGGVRSVAASSLGAEVEPSVSAGSSGVSPTPSASPAPSPTPGSSSAGGGSAEGALGTSKGTNSTAQAAAGAAPAKPGLAAGAPAAAAKPAPAAAAAKKAVKRL